MKAKILAWEEIGWDLERDRSRFQASDSGIVVIPKGYTFSYAR